MQLQLNVKKETEEVIAELLTLNLEANAESIQSAIDGGSTGTEIIMGVRYEMQKIKMDQLPAPLQNRIRIIVSEIGRLTS